MSRRNGESGFSLVELMVAMVITLIISGSIYGLLAAGQGAFRREPEMTERQQNIRTAMDLILRDVSAAGVGMSTFMQAFTPARDGTDTANAYFTGCANCLASPTTTGKTDELEMLANPDGN